MNLTILAVIYSGKGFIFVEGPTCLESLFISCLKNTRNIFSLTEAQITIDCILFWPALNLIFWNWFIINGSLLLEIFGISWYSWSCRHPLCFRLSFCTSYSNICLILFIFFCLHLFTIFLLWKQQLCGFFPELFISFDAVTAYSFFFVFTIMFKLLMNLFPQLDQFF